MNTIKKFTHACEEKYSRPIMNYAVIYDSIQKRSECFGNALIDEQVVLVASSDQPLDEKVIPDILDGCDSPYPNAVVYFFPKQDSDKVKTIINEMVNKWHAGKDSGISYSEFGEIYIALRHTANGLWVLTYDGSTNVGFEKAQRMFNDDFKIAESYRNKNLSLDSPFVAYNVEESAGQYFFTYFKRQKKLFELMQQEGLYDSGCGRRKKN